MEVAEEVMEDKAAEALVSHKCFSKDATVLFDNHKL